MPRQTALMQRLDMHHPIIQAPLAGGGDTPALVAAVGEAGGLGFLGAAYLTPEQIAAAAQDVRRRTARPFGINLFAPLPAPAPPAAFEPMLARLAPFHAELDLPPPSPPTPDALPFDAQFAAALETGASAFSFTFGIPPAAALAAARQRGMAVIGTATTVAEGIALMRAGVDAVVAQGSEAGGHRGTFAHPFDAAMIGTIALVPQLADAVGVPVIASGGIVDGRGIAAALVLGAQAVQMGTAFLACDEAGVPDAYKAAIAEASAQDTRLTRAFSGRPARGVANRFMQAIDADEAAILPFPLQNALTRPMRSAAARRNRAEYLSLWAGQAARLARRQPAAALVERLARETEAAIARLRG